MLAIHYGKDPWTDRWIDYCSINKIEHIKVNIYDSNIISQLKEKHISALLAQPILTDYKTSIIARSILYSIEEMGIKTFPNFDAFWHYNDKLSQKYLFESLDIPHAPMYVFYSRKEAYNWISRAKFPMVFKLRGGASASNVLLLKSKNDAQRYI